MTIFEISVTFIFYNAMTAEERLNRTLLQQSEDLKKLYNKLIKQLSHETAHSVTEVRPQELYKIAKACNASEKKKVQALLDAYSKAVMAVMQQGIITSVTLAVNGQQTTLASYTQMKGDAVDSWRTATANAFIESRMKRDGGLNLSDRVWNYTEQTKSEFEAAISCVLEDGIKNGIDAETLGRRVRKYLNEPDMMYRRYHRKVLADDGTKVDVVEWRRRVIGEDGKVHFVKEDLAKVGTGVYRSARQNGLRLAITETNMAYNYANCKRWSEEPFVLGIRIRLSGNHPEYDICDELQGEYPKDFMWRGWHPRCRCSQSAILMDRDSEEWEHLRSLPKDEYKKYVSPNAIKGFPSKFNKWIERNERKLLKAVEKGKLPYFVRDNINAIGSHLGWSEETISKVSPISSATPVTEEITYPRTKAQILAAAEARHAARTPEEIASIQQRAKERANKHALMRKTADDVLKEAGDYHDVDSAALSKAIEEGNLDKMYSLAKQTAKQLEIVKKDEAALSKLIPNVHEWKQQFSSEELHQVYDAVEKKMADIAAKPLNAYKYSTLLEQQKAHIENEIKYVADPNHLKKHCLYPTWKVAQEAYTKQLDDIIYKIEINEIKVELKPIQEYVAEHKGAKKLIELLGNVEDSITANGELSVISAHLSELNKRWTTLQKSNATRSASNNHIVFKKGCFTESRKKKAKAFNDALEADKYFFKDAVSAYSIATSAFKKAAEAYTANSSSITRILRGQDGWLEYEHSYMIEDKPHIEAMTEMISKIRLRNDCWITRDERVAFFTLKAGGFDVNVLNENMNSYSSKLNAKYRSKYGTITPELQREIDDKTLLYQKHEERQLIGRMGTDPSFCSTSSHINARFSGTGGDNKFGDPKIHLEIYCPKGTQALYAAPYNHYNGKKLGADGFWDGKSKPTSIHEAEIFLQRGTKFRVVNAEYDKFRDRWNVKVEVIEQNPKNIVDYERVYDKKRGSYGYKAVFE